MNRGSYLAVALAFTAATASAGESLPTCESALTSFVQILNSKSQLSGDSFLYRDAPPDESFSPCILEGNTSYILYRSDDDTTILVEKRSHADRAGVLYGPFMSAYRK